jgi:hypothetical protein
VKPSRCHEDFLERRKKNDQLKVRGRLYPIFALSVSPYLCYLCGRCTSSGMLSEKSRHDNKSVHAGLSLLQQPDTVLPTDCWAESLMLSGRKEDCQCVCGDQASFVTAQHDCVSLVVALILKKGPSTGSQVRTVLVSSKPQPHVEQTLVCQLPLWLRWVRAALLIEWRTESYLPGLVQKSSHGQIKNRVLTLR